MTISLRFAARSDVGLVRQSNQDSGYAGPHLCLLCDGMGGPAGGDIASAVAVEHLMPLDADSHQAGELLSLLRSAVQDAHAELIAAEEAALPEHICKLLTSVRDEEDSNDADRILQRTVFHNAEP